MTKSTSETARNKQGRGSIMTAAFALLRGLLLLTMLSVGTSWPAAAAPMMHNPAPLAQNAPHGGVSHQDSFVQTGVMPEHCRDRGAGQMIACNSLCLMSCGVVQSAALPVIRRVAVCQNICEGAVSWRSFDREPLVPPPRSIA